MMVELAIAHLQGIVATNYHWHRLPLEWDLNIKIPSS